MCQVPTVAFYNLFQSFIVALTLDFSEELRLPKKRTKGAFDRLTRGLYEVYTSGRADERGGAEPARPPLNTPLQTHRSMYPSIFNRFPVIQPVSSKVRHFSTFLHILASPGYDPGTIAINVTWMERGFNAGQTHSSIYPSIFNRL